MFFPLNVCTLAICLTLHQSSCALSFGSAFSIPTRKPLAYSTRMSPLQVSSESYTIHVSHQGQSADLKINQNESILSALERSSIHDKLSLSKLPQECRRGNCLTCSSRHAKNSNINNVELREDGLSPSLVDEIKDRNFVLTCSSYVLGDGVELELDVCDDVWREIHIDRVINDEDGERIRNEAVAKTIRMANEKNYYKWSKKTEKLLMESDDE